MRDQCGYVGLTKSDLIEVRADAAVNVPIITDKLALRVAGLFDDNEGTGVKNVARNQDSRTETDSYRATLGFQPIDDLNLVLMHQNMSVDRTSFTQVEGSGLGFNGPAIRGTQREAVSDGRCLVSQDAKITSTPRRGAHCRG